LSGFAKSPGRGKNQLLAALSKENFARLSPRLENVPIRIRQIVYEPEKPIEFVYFPLTAVFSQVVTMANGDVIEAATVGREGMIGLPVLLAADRSPLSAFGQIEGEASRMRAGHLRREIRTGGSLTQTFLRYAGAHFVQVAQGGACNQLHSVRQRCARWLLLTRDRVDTDEFTLTHEFLCQMLAVRRATVSEIAAAFQHEGLIRYTRGRMMVLDRVGLEAASCECYRVIRREYEQALGRPEAAQA
jgi:CRP-like cAMP-binding protein